MKKLFGILSLSLAAAVAFAEDAYLESDGTQYIVTGYHPTEKMKLVVDCQITEETKSKSIFGSYVNKGTGVSFQVWQNSSPNLEFGHMKEGNAEGWLGRLRTGEITQRYTYEIDYPKGKVYLKNPDGTIADTTYGTKTMAADRRTGTAERPLSFFCSTPGLANADQTASKMKLYSAQVTENGAIIHDYVPCKKGDRIGLYDKKTGEFWGSVTRQLAIAGDYMTIDDDPYISCAGNNISSGTKAILDTNYKPNAKTRIELDYALAANYTEGWTGDWALMMAHTTTGKNEDGLLSVYQNASTFGVSIDSELWKGLGTFGKPVTYSKDVRRTMVMDISRGKASVLVSGYPAGGYEMTSSWREDKVYKTLKIGGYDSGTGGCAPLKIYGFKIYEDDELIHDYVPAKIGDEGFLKDKVTGLTLSLMNPPYPFAASENAEALPYVESTGNQIVVLDYKPNVKSVIEVDTDGLERVKNTSIFGVSDNSGSCQFHVNGSTDANGPGMEAYMHSVWGWRMVTGLEKFGQRVKFMLDVPKSYAYARKADGSNYGSTNFAKDHTGYSADVDETTIPMALFNVNKSTVALAEGAKVKIYSAKVWEDGELLHSYQPCVKDGVVGFKDMVTGNFFSGVVNAGTTRVDSLKLGGATPLIEGQPSEAYLESDATQYIKTGYFPKETTRLEIDFELLGLKNDYYIFGRNQTPNWELYVSGAYTYRAIGHTGWATVDAGNAMCERKTIAIDRPAGKVYVTDHGSATPTSYNLPAGPSSGTPTYDLYLLATQNNGSDFGHTPMRLYAFRVYEAGQLVHEYLPYADEEIVGLKDTKTGKVLTNSKEGAHPFVVGGQGYKTASGAKATFATTLSAKASVKYSGKATLGPVYAPGAVKYVWTKDGEVIAGENGPSLDIAWQKKPAAATYAVKPVYNVYGVETEGEASNCDIEFVRAGLAILVR